MVKISTGRFVQPPPAKYLSNLEMGVFSAFATYTALDMSSRRFPLERQWKNPREKSTKRSSYLDFFVVVGN